MVPEGRKMSSRGLQRSSFSERMSLLGQRILHNENCRMKHDPKLKGSSKRGRSRSPPNRSPVDKRSRTEEKKVDVYYNNTIEERLRKQDEQNHFLAKSLAGLSAEVKNLSSQQKPNPILPSGSQEQTWGQNAQTPRQPQVNYGLPSSQTPTPFNPPAPNLPPQHYYNPYQ